MSQMSQQRSFMAVIALGLVVSAENQADDAQCSSTGVAAADDADADCSSGSGGWRENATHATTACNSASSCFWLILYKAIPSKKITASGVLPFSSNRGLDGEDRSHYDYQLRCVRPPVHTMNEAHPPRVYIFLLNLSLLICFWSFLLAGFCSTSSSSCSSESCAST